ncbi:hypothetical protein DMN91_001262 [Ooceraea biroi]|uniref:Uncharacterized protein n=1 Tax=Ooceraea biroi TaxID=2015173 RepID=A0A3L8E761_OOCBI|nr:hypothetical protein DMN91_001262 [Ooceraea biroi]
MSMSNTAEFIQSDITSETSNVGACKLHSVELVGRSYDIIIVLHAAPIVSPQIQPIQLNIARAIPYLQCPARLPDAEQGKRDKGARGPREQKLDTSTGTPGLWGWPSPGSLNPQERPEIELSAIRRGFDLGYRVGGKFQEHVREFSCGMLYYRTLYLDSKRDALYVGAMDKIFRLNLSNISHSNCEVSPSEAFVWHRNVPDLLPAG